MLVFTSFVEGIKPINNQIRTVPCPCALPLPRVNIKPLFLPDDITVHQVPVNSNNPLLVTMCSLPGYQVHTISNYGSEPRDVSVFHTRWQRYTVPDTVRCSGLCVALSYISLPYLGCQNTVSIYPFRQDFIIRAIFDDPKVSVYDDVHLLGIFFFAGQDRMPLPLGKESPSIGRWRGWVPTPTCCVRR